MSAGVFRSQEKFFDPANLIIPVLMMKYPVVMSDGSSTSATTSHLQRPLKRNCGRKAKAANIKTATMMTFVLLPGVC